MAVSKYSNGAGEALAKFAIHCQYVALETASTAHLYKWCISLKLASKCINQIKEVGHKSAIFLQV